MVGGGGSGAGGSLMVGGAGSFEVVAPDEPVHAAGAATSNAPLTANLRILPTVRVVPSAMRGSYTAIDAHSQRLVAAS